MQYVMSVYSGKVVQILVPPSVCKNAQIYNEVSILWQHGFPIFIEPKVKYNYMGNNIIQNK